MSVPVPYYVHALDYKKGWPSPTAVDFDAKLSSNVTGLAYSGRCVHLNSSGEFELGALGTQMPGFLIPGAGDYDVQNQSISGPQAWYPIQPSGKMSALMAAGSFELETTEYDQTDNSIAVNALLHSPTESQTSGDKTLAGLLYAHRNWSGGNTNAVTQYVDNVCGVVSRAPTLNALRQNVLAFWPYFLPGQDSTH